MKQGSVGVPSIDQWLLDNLAVDSKVGTDPFLITSTEFERLSGVLAGGGISLLTMQRNLVDSIWNNRPPQSNGSLIPLDIKYSGECDLRNSSM